MKRWKILAVEGRTFLVITSGWKRRRIEIYILHPPFKWVKSSFVPQAGEQK